MNLDEGQRQKVSAWIAEGLKLSDNQKRIETEFGLRLTYLESRLLMNELQLSPKDQEIKSAVSKTVATTGPTSTQAPSQVGGAPGGGGVSLSVDHVTRPGALVSGKVTFSDGQSAEWFLDQMGRMGFIPKQQGYRPPESDIEEFQTQLQSELQKLGY
jgi:hypothetical protein